MIVRDRDISLKVKRIADNCLEETRRKYVLLQLDSHRLLKETILSIELFKSE